MKNFEIIFDNEKLRIETNNNEPWFVLSDLCKILKLKNPAQRAKGIPKDDITLIYIIDSLGRQQKTYIVNEPALYRLISRSRSKQSVKFQNKLYNEILPQIRKTGKYIDNKEKSLRLKSAVKRNLFTASLKEHGINKPYEYIQLTYETKVGVGIDRNKKKKDFDMLELLRVGIAEDIATLQIELSNPTGFKEIKPIVKSSSKIVNDIKGKIT